MYEFYDSNSQTCANVNNVKGQYLSSSTETCILQPNILGVTFSTVTTSPTSYWSKSKGIANVYSLNSCTTPIGYTWESSSCVFQANDDYTDDNAGTSILYYCTTKGLVTEQYYGSNCKSKNLMLQEETYKLPKINNLYDYNLYEKTNNITISSTGESFNIGSIYSQFDCKHKPQLSYCRNICMFNILNSFNFLFIMLDHYCKSYEKR